MNSAAENHSILSRARFHGDKFQLDFIVQDKMLFIMLSYGIA